MSARRPEALGLLLMLAVTLATRLPAFGNPAAEFDEQLYSLIGAQWLHGVQPYTELWDRKPPGLFAIYAAAHWVGGDGTLAYLVFALIACLLGGWQVWRLALHLTDRRTAALAASLYPALMGIFDCYGGQSEIFFTPVLMAMAQLLLLASDRPLATARRLCLAAMACGGLALQIKYTALAQCLFFGMAALWLLRRKGCGQPRLLFDAALFAGLGILPTLIAAMWFASAGALDDFVFAQFVSIGLRTAMPFSWLIGEQSLLAIPVIAIAGGGIFFALRSRRRGEAPGLWWLALLWLAAGIAGLFMVRTIYFYYYGALVPAVILVGLPLFDQRNRWGLAAYGVILVGIVAGFDPVGRIAQAQSERQALHAMVQAMKPHVGRRSHCLYVFDGPTVLYRLAGSGLPTRIIYPDHLNNVLENRSLPVDPADEARRIFGQRPGAVVNSRDFIAPRNPATDAIVAGELASHYRLLGHWTVQGRQLDLYARRPDADGVAPDCTLR